MKRERLPLTLLLIAVMLATAAALCVAPSDGTPTPVVTIVRTIVRTETPEATEIGENSTITPVVPTLVRTTVPTETDGPTPTVEVPPTVVPLPANRLANPDFEDGWYNYTTATGGGSVPDGWYITACNTPFTPEKCVIPPPYCEGGVTASCNDRGYLATCEWKEGKDDPNRVYSGTNSAQFFAFGTVVECGLWQVVPTIAGEDCTLRVWAMTWGSNTGFSNVSGNIYRSDYRTEDDKQNLRVRLAAYTDGPLPAFPYNDGPVLSSEEFGYYDFIYDEGDFRRDGYPNYEAFPGRAGLGGAFVELPFTAQSDQATVFLFGMNRYPIGNSNFYFDHASVTCSGFETPTPIEGQSTPAATPLGG